jgi:hypothetical protein
MKRNEAKQQEADRLMYAQQLLSQRSILLDQGRQLTNKE